jgi:aminoglycoside phosphotransferase (APT) family kinase protein
MSSSSEVETGLVEVLAPALGGVAVEHLVRLSAGANRETWSFDAVTATGERHGLILQRQRGGTALPDQNSAEAAILRHARAGGVTVADVIAADGPPNPLDRDYVIVRRLEGESIARRILRDAPYEAARGRFVADCARELAAIHALDPAALAADLLTVDDPVLAQRVSYERFDDPHPVFELAFRWLGENQPALRPASVVHGDFRMGNLLVDEHGISAVLDWELCHLGDPIVDLGWLVARPWRFGGPGEVGGIGSKAELLDAYAAAGGDQVSLEDLRWWEVLATLRWGNACMFMVDDHRRGRSRSVELATIGRRVVEVEYDLLLLLPELVA